MSDGIDQYSGTTRDPNTRDAQQIAYREQVVMCDVPANSEGRGHAGTGSGLSGVLTLPTTRVPGLPVIVLLNSGLVRRVGARRLSVRIARRLATNGFLVLRFDLAGLGDSASQAGASNFLDSARADLEVMLDYLEAQHGGERFVLAGLCSGADVALHAASQERVCGVIQMNPHIHKNKKYYLHQAGDQDWWKRVFARHVVSRLRRLAPKDNSPISQPATWGPAPSHVERQADLVTLAQNDVSLLTIFTMGTISYPGQFQDVYSRAKFNAQFQCAMRMQGDHVISATHDQAWVLDTIEDWCSSSFPRR